MGVQRRGNCEMAGKEVMPSPSVKVSVCSVDRLGIGAAVDQRRG